LALGKAHPVLLTSSFTTFIRNDFLASPSPVLGRIEKDEAPSSIRRRRLEKSATSCSYKSNVSVCEFLVIIPHLLVAEEDPAISHVLKALLAYGGMSCDIVASALAGLRGEGRLRYSALIIDLGVPDAEGLQLIRAICADHFIPIVVLAGRASEEDKVSILDAGADEFMLKPFFPNELLARIRSLLRRSSYPALPAA
jgi:CheY-like chemotaxis protein